MRLKALSVFVALGALPLLALAVDHALEIRRHLSDHAQQRVEAAARSTATLIGYQVEIAHAGISLGGAAPSAGGTAEARGPAASASSSPLPGATVCTRASRAAATTTSFSSSSAFRPLLRRDIGQALATRGTDDRTRLLLLDPESGMAATDGGCGAAALDPAWKAVSDRPEGARASDGDAGSALIAGVSPVPGTSWVVVALAHPVLPAVQTAQAGAVFWALLFVLCGGVVVWVLTARWLRPIEELRKAIAGIGDGDLAGWVPPPGGDEVGSLTASFKRMSDRLAHMVRHVEQSSRLEAVGVMAAHLAHEVRSPLSSIRLNLQGLNRKLASGEIPADHEPAIRVSLREVERLEKTIDSVLQVGGGRPDRLSKPKACSLHGILEDVRDVLQSVLEKRNVRVLFELGAETDRVRVDPGRLKGVFMNLLVNASEAMPDGGTVRIRSSLELDHEGRHVIQVTVRDSGPGVPAEIRDEIFDPFMTTKDEGSGLGLAASLRAVRDEGGDLSLIDTTREGSVGPTEGGPGACFSVVIPIAPRRSRDRTALVPSSSGDFEHALQPAAYAAQDGSVSGPSGVASTPLEG